MLIWPDTQTVSYEPRPVIFIFFRIMLQVKHCGHFVEYVYFFNGTEAVTF